MTKMILAIMTLSSVPAFAQDNSIVISGADKVEAAISLIDNTWDGMRSEETTEGYTCTKNLLNHGPSRAKLIVGKALTSIAIRKMKETRSTTTFSIKTYHGPSSEAGSQIECYASKSSEVVTKLLSLKD